jgi:hypothetical protein
MVLPADGVHREVAEAVTAGVVAHRAEGRVGEHRGEGAAVDQSDVDVGRAGAEVHEAQVGAAQLGRTLPSTKARSAKADAPVPARRPDAATVARAPAGSAGRVTSGRPARAVLQLALLGATMRAT